MRLHSPAFTPDQPLDRRFTKDGEDRSPPLVWDDVPEGTRSFALVVEDPDAPDPEAPKTTWIHWIVANIPREVRELPEGAADGRLPEGVRVGRNDWGEAAYGGPDPPKGRHRYVHRLFALDAELDVDTPSREDLDRAMEGHVLAEARLVGTYAKEGAARGS